ncbi:MAG: glycosyltransferase family 39 protein [Candidatus Omnitrophica bacterium]|nr:glycosyltransferase family 39 protein [Candidatus Omnitrophota bacterium]
MNDKLSGKVIVMMLCIIALGFALRAAGINFGLPYLYHADEPNIVNRAVAYGTGDLNPHYFQIPPLASYILFFEYGAYFLLGKLFGFFPDLQVFKIEFFSDPSVFYLIGRISFGLVTGVLTILAVYFTAKRLFSREAGVLSALFLSVSFLHVRDSHYLYLDVTLTLLIVLAFLWSLKIYDSGKTRDYVLAGLWIGLATAFKYNGCLVFVALLLAHLLREPARDWFLALWKKELWISVITIFAVFVVCNPFFILDWQTFWTSFFAETHAQGSSGWLHHFSYSLAQGIGGLFLLWCLFGLVFCPFILGKRGLILLSFPVLFYITLTRFSQIHDRYVIPLIPFLVLAGGITAAYVFDKVLLNKAKWLRAPFIVFLILLVVPTAAKSAVVDYLFTRKDTRTEAKEWIEATIPSGMAVALDHSFFCPALAPVAEQIAAKKDLIRVGDKHFAKKNEKLNALLSLVKAGDKRYKLYYLVGEGEENNTPKFILTEPVIPRNLGALRKNGIKYVCVAKYWSGYDEAVPFYGELVKKGRLIKVFTPYMDNSVRRPFNAKNIRTGAPSLDKEIFSRRSNGEIIEIYEIE